MINWSLIFSRFVVSGIVLDQNGKPVTNVQLTFHASENDALHWEKYYEKTVVCYSRSDGRFRVGSPYGLLQLRGIAADGYVGEMNDAALQKGYTRATSGVTVHVYLTKSTARVVDHTQPKLIEPTRAGAILLDLTTGNVTASKASADLEITFQALEVEIRAVNGGVRLAGSEAIEAPVGDYIEGARASWANYPAMTYSPMYVSGFFESQGQRHIGHFDLRVDPPDKASGLSKLSIQTLVNIDGGRTLGRPLVRRDNGSDKRNSANSLVLTEGPWWIKPGGLQPILSKQDALAALAANPIRVGYNHLDDALARSRADDAVYTAIINRNWSMRDTNVLRALAENPSVPDKILMKLATHPDVLVRRSLAQRKRIPQELREALRNDPDGSVRSASERP